MHHRRCRYGCAASSTTNALVLQPTTGFLLGAHRSKELQMWDTARTGHRQPPMQVLHERLARRAAQSDLHCNRNTSWEQHPTGCVALSTRSFPSQARPRTPSPAGLQHLLRHTPGDPSPARHAAMPSSRPVCEAPKCGAPCFNKSAGQSHRSVAYSIMPALMSAREVADRCIQHAVFIRGNHQQAANACSVPTSLRAHLLYAVGLNCLIDSNGTIDFSPNRDLR